jgi:hypothetical protein
MAAEAVAAIPCRRWLRWRTPARGRNVTVIRALLDRTGLPGDTAPAGPHRGRRPRPGCADVGGVGGLKSSGIGREECVEELLSFTETKAVHLAYS